MAASSRALSSPIARIKRGSTAARWPSRASISSAVRQVALELRGAAAERQHPAPLGAGAELARAGATCRCPARRSRRASARSPPDTASSTAFKRSSSAVRPTIAPATGACGADMAAILRPRRYCSCASFWRSRLRASAKCSASNATSPASTAASSASVASDGSSTPSGTSATSSARADQPLLVERVDVAPAERDVGEQVERCAAEQRDRRDQLERVLDVLERLLHAERDQHDPGDHREVQERVGVARDPVLLAARLRRCRAVARPRARRRRSRATTSRRPRRPERGGGDDAGVDACPGADADRDDRLAERDDDDQPVALGEVAWHQLPALRAEQHRPAHVERERERPQRALRRPVGERRARRAARRRPRCWPLSPA